MYDSRPGTALGKPPIDPFHGFPEHFPPGTHCNRSRGKSVLGSHETGLWGLPRAAIIHTTNLPPVCPSQARVFHPFVPARPMYSTRMPQSRPVRSPGPCAVQARMSQSRPEALGGGWVMGALTHTCQRLVNSIQISFWKQVGVLQQPGKFSKFAPPGRVSVQSVHRFFVPVRPVYSTRLSQPGPCIPLVCPSPGPCAVQVRAQSRPVCLSPGPKHWGAAG